MERGSGSIPPSGSSPLGAGKLPADSSIPDSSIPDSSKPEKPPVTRVSPTGNGRQSSTRLSERKAKSSTVKPILNPDDINNNDLLRGYQAACLTMENLLGQQYLYSHYRELVEFLKNPNAASYEKLPFDIHYVDEEGQVHSVDTFEVEQSNELKVRVSELAPSREIVEGLKVRTNQAMDGIIYSESLLKSRDVDVTPVRLSASSVKLDLVKVNEPVRLPGHSPVSIVETKYFQDIAGKLESGFVYNPTRAEPQRVPVVQPVRTKPVKPFKAEQMTSAGWLDFYNKSDTLVSGQKWTHNNVMQLDADHLEAEHDYIQLLFPNRHVSPFNDTAPLLTDEMVVSVQQNPALQRQVLQSLDRMLDFWGCTRTGDSIEVNPMKKAAHEKWALHDNDHNHQRVTRVLNFLMECGYENAAANLERTLQQHRREQGAPLNIFWSEAIEKRRNSQRVHFSKDTGESIKTVRDYDTYAKSHPYPAFADRRLRQDFYNSNEACYEFTNFWNGAGDLKLKIGDRNWRTTEHYFQAMKYTDQGKQEQVRGKVTAREAFAFTREPGNQPRSDWPQVKEKFMLEALREKAKQNQQFRRLLENTGNKVLVESSDRDSYWGYGGNKGGLNKLGYMLMQVRDEIRAGLL